MLSLLKHHAGGERDEIKRERAREPERESETQTQRDNRESSNPHATP
jgi:hypothetical protein